MTDIPLVHNVQNSYKAAATALEHLANELRRAGFQDSLTTYETMVRTLILQQEWLISNAPDELHKSDFERVQRAAQEIVSILQPYVRLMLSLALAGKEKFLEENSVVTLKNVDVSQTGGSKNNTSKAVSDQFKKESVEERILEILAGDEQITITRIASQLGIPTRSVKQVMDQLVAKGLVQLIGKARPNYRLSQHAAFKDKSE